MLTLIFFYNFKKINYEERFIKLLNLGNLNKKSYKFQTTKLCATFRNFIKISNAFKKILILKLNFFINLCKKVKKKLLN